jgi:hypothetical protein
MRGLGGKPFSLQQLNDVADVLNKEGFDWKRARKCPNCKKRFGVHARPSQLHESYGLDEEWVCIRCLAVQGDPRWYEELFGRIYPPPHGFSISTIELK